MDCPHRIPPSGTPAPHTMHTAFATPDQALDTTGKTEEEETNPDHSLDTAKYHSSSHHDLHRGSSRSQQWDSHSQHRSSSRQSQSAYCGHSHRPCYDAPHWSQCKYSTHGSSPGYCSHDHCRLHSQPPYQLSKYSLHQKGKTQFRIIPQPGKQKIPSKEEYGGPDRRATIGLLQFH